MKNIITALFMFLGGMFTSQAQDFINKDNFNKKIAKGIVAVEFWASWNASNEFLELSNLKDCKTYRIDISTNMEVQSKYGVSAIPTVIIFESGSEKVRFLPNIMFKLDVDKKTVQHSVDTLILNKFN